MVIFIAIISAILFAFYFRDLKRNPITTKKMVVIAMMSGLSFMLSLIQFVKYPQGGGITLFSMLPIMILSLLYGRIFLRLFVWANGFRFYMCFW